VLVLGVLGFVVGATRWRGRLDRGTALRRERLRVELSGPGITFADAERGALEVHGLTPEQVGDAAAAAGIALHELSPQQASLEEAFMNLTRDELEFAAEIEEAVA